MLSKCANPECSAVLHRLQDGRLFVFDVPVIQARGTGPAPGAKHHRPQYHWLCSECSKTLTVSCKDGSVVTVARGDRRREAQAS